MAVTKNNPNARRGALEKRVYKGMELEPVKYYGKHVGQANYVAARQAKTNNIITDENGVPLRWENIPNEGASAAQNA